MQTELIKEFSHEFARYRSLGDKAISQVPDDALNQILSPDNNSITMLVRHISGNFLSRFTDFLTSDGEKPWRNRDSEFEDATYDRQAVQRMWAAGWDLLESELSKLSDEQMRDKVYIRGEAWTVHGALCRSLAHVSYHVGQIVFLARVLNQGTWQWLSIPKGQSAKYNRNLAKEGKPE